MSSSLHPDNKVHGAHPGPIGPRWAPCWPHEPCFQSGYHQVLLARHREESGKLPCSVDTHCIHNNSVIWHLTDGIRLWLTKWTMGVSIAWPILPKEQPKDHMWEWDIRWIHELKMWPMFYLYCSADCHIDAWHKWDVTPMCEITYVLNSLVQLSLIITW